MNVVIGSGNSAATLQAAANFTLNSLRTLVIPPSVSGSTSTIDVEASDTLGFGGTIAANGKQPRQPDKERPGILDLTGAKIQVAGNDYGERRNSNTRKRHRTEYGLQRRQRGDAIGRRKPLWSLSSPQGASHFRPTLPLRPTMARRRSPAHSPVAAC